MFGLLKPHTLSHIIADLEFADEESWIANEEERQALEDAKSALVALIGQNDADAMIDGMAAE